MRSYFIAMTGSLEGLAIEERPEPQPGDTEVLIRVQATSLNYRDLLILKNGYGRSSEVKGRVPLSDGAGDVIAVGSKVSRFRVGDRVVGNFFPKWIGGLISKEAISIQPTLSEDGWLTEFRVADENSCLSIPDHLSFEEAATLPCAALTAWSALTAHRRVLPGETVLVQGSGGVSVFALQFAKLMGARVIAITSTDEKSEKLVKLGADLTINYRENPDWDVVVREISNGRGADHIVEVGGVGTLERSIKGAALGAQINLIGVLADAASFDPSILRSNILSIIRCSVGNRQNFEEMNAAISTHRLKPVVGKSFDFPRAREAYSYFDNREHFGKVVIRHR